MIYCIYESDLNISDLADEEEETGEPATGADSAGKRNRNVSESQVSFCVHTQMFLSLR